MVDNEFIYLTELCEDCLIEDDIIHDVAGLMIGHGTNLGNFHHHHLLLLLLIITPASITPAIQTPMADEQQIEARERRRAKILASKDARMARITGVHKNESSSSSESLKVDEIVLQEYIAEGKKHAVELAKEDYTRTHREFDNGEPDKVLTPEEIARREKEDLERKLDRIRADSPASHLELFTSMLVVLISACTAAFFLVSRIDAKYKFCFNPQGIPVAKIGECRGEIGTAALQTIPAAFVMALLPLLSDWFKGRKGIYPLLCTALSRSILFLVIFLLALRILA